MTTQSLSERLRLYATTASYGADLREAADALDAKAAEIERLRKENKELRRDVDLLYAQVLELQSELQS